MRIELKFMEQNQGIGHTTWERMLLQKNTKRCTEDHSSTLSALLLLDDRANSMHSSLQDKAKVYEYSTSNASGLPVLLAVSCDLSIN